MTKVRVVREYRIHSTHTFNREAGPSGHTHSSSTLSFTLNHLYHFIHDFTIFSYILVKFQIVFKLYKNDKYNFIMTCTIYILYNFMMT